jgi:predicted alternative tryptophan synthase beta-subunit
VLSIVEADSNFRTVIGIDYYEDVKDLYVEIDAISGELQGSKIEHTGQPVTEAGVSGKWTKMRLVAVDGFFSVYVNDTPVAYYEDDTNAGLINRIKVFTLGKRVLVDIDNIKFWNLDGVNINP